MTEEELFRLKPGDLLRIDNGTGDDFLPAHYAIVVAGAGPHVTLAWLQRRLRNPSARLATQANFDAFFDIAGHWRTLNAEVVSSVLHRARLTRIA